MRECGDSPGEALEATVQDPPAQSDARDDVDADAAEGPNVSNAGIADDADLRPLVRRAQARDAEAFGQLIRRFERRALAVAYGVMGDAERAGDVAQEAFARAWERIGELKEPQRFGAWVCGMVRNLSIDLHRKERVRTTVHGAMAREGAVASQRSSSDVREPVEQMLKREQQARLAVALEQLDPVTRTAVTLRYYEGLSSKEIGQTLNLAPAAVDMRLSRARVQLREMLK